MAAHPAIDLPLLEDPWRPVHPWMGTVRRRHPDGAARHEGPCRREPLPILLRDWQAGGRLEIQSARIAQGDTLANATGTLALRSGPARRRLAARPLRGSKLSCPPSATEGRGPQSRPRRAGTQRDRSRRAGSWQRLAPQRSTMAVGLLGLLGKPVEIEGKRGVSVPVRFKDGKASFGPIPLGQVPPAFQRWRERTRPTTPSSSAGATTACLRRLSGEAGLQGRRAGAARTSSAARRSRKNSIRASATRSPPTRSRCSTRRSSPTCGSPSTACGSSSGKSPISCRSTTGAISRPAAGRTHEEVAKFSRARRGAAPRLSGAAGSGGRRAARARAGNAAERGRGHPFAAISELIKSGRIANRRRPGLDLQRDLLDLFTNSAGDWLDGWFESDPIKAAVWLRQRRRQLREPVHAGLGLCAAAPLLRRGERQEGRLGPRDRRHGGDHPGDGEGGRAEAREIRLEAPVREVLAEKGRAVGVGDRERAKRSAPARSSRTCIRGCCSTAR